jgi:hypothetical protein
MLMEFRAETAQRSSITKWPVRVVRAFEDASVLDERGCVTDSYAKSILTDQALQEASH